MVLDYFDGGNGVWCIIVLNIGLLSLVCAATNI